MSEVPSKATAIGETIRQLREERGWSLRELADRMGLTHSSVGRKERGLLGVKPPERRKFAEVFGLTLDEFDRLWRSSQVERTRGDNGIPVINRAPAGRIVDYEEYGVDSGQGFEYLDWGTVNDALAFAVIVVGDSMEPRLHDGDYLILSPCDPYRPSQHLSNGKIVFVRFTEEAGGGCMLARWFVDGDTIRLAKDNPAYPGRNVDRSDVQLVAVAVERRERFA